MRYFDQRIDRRATGTGAEAGGPTPGKQTLVEASGAYDHAAPAVEAAASSSGEPLPADLQHKFEASLGADLSDVRIHRSAESQTAAAAVGAKAYAHGRNIHFGTGQYMPSTPEGEHLLAHEVAHTVQQQGGIKRLQLKSLAVSQPTDSHEVEADRAADAMVAGKQASVADAPIGLHRKTGDAEVDVMSGDASVDVGEVKKEVSLGPIKLTPSLSGSVKLKNKNVSAPETAGPGGISTNVSATKDSVKLSAEKEVGPENWTIKPKLSGDIKADKNGVTFGFGVSVSHPGFSFQNLHAGPFSIEGKIVEWEVGKTPKFLCVTPSAKLSADVPGTYMGYQVTPELTFACDIEPNWVEMAKYLAEAVAAAADTAAFAIAAPLGTGIVMLVGWAKAGHEFDEVQQRIEGMRARCKLATREAMTGVHYSWGLPGGGDMNADTSAVAAQIRTIVAQQAGIPEGAFPDIAKAKPAIADKLYQAAWKQLWYGDLKPKLVAAYQDTTFTSYKFERMWLDTFDTGDFSKG